MITLHQSLPSAFGKAGRTTGHEEEKREEQHQQHQQEEEEEEEVYVIREPAIQPACQSAVGWVRRRGAAQQPKQRITSVGARALDEVVVFISVLVPW